jgi:hypothetical protein
MHLASPDLARVAGAPFDESLHSFQLSCACDFSAFAGVLV